MFSCTLRSWLDPWSGIGHVAVGMHRQGFDLQLTQYDERDAVLGYFWIGGRIAYLHAACDALWKQERESQEGI